VWPASKEWNDAELGEAGNILRAYHLGVLDAESVISFRHAP